MSADRKLIEVAQSALRDLYGLVPEKDRGHGIDYLRVLEHALNAYSDTLSRVRQIEAALYHGNRVIENKLAEMESVGLE
jgi:hypothetical protein